MRFCKGAKPTDSGTEAGELHTKMNRKHFKIIAESFPNLQEVMAIHVEEAFTVNMKL